MKPLILFCSAVLLLCIASLSTAEEVFAPFVSRLQAVPDGNTIKLSWMDSTDKIAAYFVYRSSARITDSTFSSSKKIAVVPSGKEFYIDVPGKKGSYFYAVLAVNTENKPYRLFIPFRNVTDHPVRISSTKTPEELSTDITAIKTTVLDKKIKISFKSSKPDRKVTIFRSTSPLQESADLSNAAAIATVPSAAGVYFDTPVPDISYYYGIFDTLLSSRGTYRIKQGENVTKNSTELPLTAVLLPKETSPLVIREQPLPFLDLQIGIESGKPLSPSSLQLPPYKELTPEVLRAVSGLLQALPPYEPSTPTPVIFPQDRSAKENSENYQLVRILATDFIHKNWVETEKLLGNFMSLRHSEKIVVRTHFYMGQVLYFLKKYRASFMEFTLVENHLYRETRPWLDSLFFLLQ